MEFYYFVESRSQGAWALCVANSADSVVEPQPISLDLTACRIYGLYGFLMELRPNRGLPADLSTEGHALARNMSGDLWGGGHTWLTLLELQETDWPDWLRETHEYKTAMPRMADLGEPEDVRLICWCDY